MLPLIKKLLPLVFAVLTCFSSFLPVNAMGLYEPGVIYERHIISEGRVILCRVNPQTGMDESSFDNGKTWTVVGGEFDDIQGVWCKNEVKVSYESGILKGKNSSEFAPYELLTNTQVLEIASRLKGYWQGRQDIWDWESTEIPRHVRYQNYLEANGIVIPEILAREPNSPCTRYNFAKILYAVTEEENLRKINEVKYIADTEDSDIKNLYEAGILSVHTGDTVLFEGERGITRGAAAAVIARLVKLELRVKV